MASGWLSYVPLCWSWIDSASGNGDKPKESVRVKASNRPSVRCIFGTCSGVTSRTIVSPFPVIIL